jgi:hypothetical protein
VIRPPTWQPGVGAFATLMLAGDMVKLAFLKVHDFEVHDTPGLVLFRFTSVYVAAYLVVQLLEPVR